MTQNWECRRCLRTGLRSYSSRRVDNFDAGRVEALLNAAGFDQVRRAGVASMFVTDPDETPIQLSAVDGTYRV